MSPEYFLLLLIAVTLAAWLAHVVNRNRHQRRLRRLAAEWRMHYSPGDRFRLADRVAEKLPIPGAADVRVVDLIYGNEPAGYRYIFSAEFTRGVVRWKTRVRRVVSFSEPKDRTDANGWSALMLGDEQLPVVRQYEKLHSQHDAQT